jgi:hypothetical protein
MVKSKQFNIIVKRINNNRFIVQNQDFDYLQLLNWFKEVITE